MEGMVALKGIERGGEMGSECPGLYLGHEVVLLEERCTV